MFERWQDWNTALGMSAGKAGYERVILNGTGPMIRSLDLGAPG